MLHTFHTHSHVPHTMAKLSRESKARLHWNASAQCGTETEHFGNGTIAVEPIGEDQTIDEETQGGWGTEEQLMLQTRRNHNLASTD